jgi:DNA-binding transcriptional LysR family regulator
MIDWDNLRIALAVHRTGSIAAAAAGLDVDRTTVLRRLDALELQLGARLFERRPGGCVLTRSGASVLERVGDMEELVLSLASRVAGEDQRTSGVVRITLPVFVAAYLLAPDLGKLRDQHPGLEVELLTGQRLFNLARREADIAIRNLRPAKGRLVSRRVGTAAFALFASPGYLARRGTPGAALAGHDVILFDESLAVTPGYRAFAARAEAGRAVLRASEMPVALAAVREGVGIGLLPCVALRAAPELVALPPGPLARTEVHAVTHADIQRTARIRAVLGFIAGCFADHATLLAGAAALPGRSRS